MQHTSKYQFKLIEGTDSFSPAPLNDNMERIEEKLEELDVGLTEVQEFLESGENCKIAWGNYTGNGTYGSSNKNSLTLPFSPKVILIIPSKTAMELNANFQGMFGIGLVHAGVLLNTGGYNSTTALTTLSLSGNTLTWYDTGHAARQFNMAATYYYLALGV